MESLKKASVVALDFETYGLHDWRTTLFSYAWRDGKKVIGVAAKPTEWDAFWEIVKDKKIVFHNADFDLKVLKFNDIDIERIDFEDTMIMSHLLDEIRRKSLKDLRVSVLGKPERKRYKDVDQDNEVEFMEYAREDAIDTLELYEEFDPLIDEEELRTVYELEKAVIFPMIDMEYYGVMVDVNLLYKQDVMLQGFIDEITAFLQNMAGYELSLTSNSQIQKFLFEDLKVHPRAEWRNKTGYSVAADVLESLVMECTGPAKVAVEKILDFRKFSKLRGTFTQGLLEKIDQHGYVRPSFNAMGAATGRFSCSNPNLQQIPRASFIEGDLDTHIRSLFLPSPGRFMITADYSQIELRMMAEISKDRRMCECFRAGIDLHQLTADMLGISRQNAKSINFGVGYGLGPGGYARGAGISWSEASAHINAFWDTYSGLDSFMGHIRRHAQSVGYVRTISGRKRRFPSEYSSDQVDRMAMNTVIQGSSADLMKMALVKIYDNLDHVRARILMTVHDEISVEVDLDYAEECLEIVKFQMEHAIQASIPLTAEPVIGKRWSENK